MMPDPSRRFVATPIEQDLQVHRTQIRLATNDERLRDRLVAHFASTSTLGAEHSGFVLRIIVESQELDPGASVAIPVHTFELDKLGYVTIGPLGFIAYDKSERLAFSFVTTELIHQDKLLSRYFLPALESVADRMRVPATSSAS